MSAAWISQLQPLTQLQKLELDLDHAVFRLNGLRDMTHLKSLALESVQITGADLFDLKAATSLTSLCIMVSVTTLHGA